MASNEIILGYWGARGRAGVLRSLLSYCGIPFKNKIYQDFNEWASGDKQTLGFDYPNLPYLIDGDKKITEVLSILYYIPIRAGKRELIGDTDEKFVKVRTALGVVGDLVSSLTQLVWTKGDFQTEKENEFNNGTIKNKLDILNKNLEGKEWLCEFFSIADFELFDALDMIYEIDSSKLEKYPKLADFHKRFGELPFYQAHRKSPEFVFAWIRPGLTVWNNV